VNKLIKKIVYDTLGVLMLIGALLFGWLPGPGGVPLLLGGLGMLSVHHDWAKKLLLKAKEHGTNFYELLFPDNKLVYLLYDVVGLGIFGTALYIILLETKKITQTAAIAAAFVAFGLLLTNRKRLLKISALVKKITKKA